MSTLRIVVRRLLAEPGFTAIAALTLSIGIGANLVVFTVVNTILLQQLPVPDSERLVILGHEPAGELHRPGQPPAGGRGQGHGLVLRRRPHAASVGPNVSGRG